MAESPTMNDAITASITFDEPTMLAGFQWYGRVNRTGNRVRAVLFFLAGLMVFSSLLVSNTQGEQQGVSVLQAIYVVLPAIGLAWGAAALGRGLERRQFLAGVKSSPLFGKTITYKAVGDQMEVTTPHSQGTLSWDMFAKTVETPDGLLLFQQRRLFNWLPKTAFTTGSDYTRFRDRAAAGTKHSKIG